MIIVTNISNNSRGTVVAYILCRYAVNKREIIPDRENLATYIGLKKSWMLGENLEIYFTKQELSLTLS